MYFNLLNIIITIINFFLGVMSWMIRVQNDRNIQDLNSADTSMFDVSTLFHPSLGIKISNGEIDRISQYLNEEVNLIIPMIIL